MKSKLFCIPEDTQTRHAIISVKNFPADTGDATLSAHTRVKNGCTTRKAQSLSLSRNILIKQHHLYIRNFMRTAKVVYLILCKYKNYIYMYTAPSPAGTPNDLLLNSLPTSVHPICKFALGRIFQALN